MTIQDKPPTTDQILGDLLSTSSVTPVAGETAYNPDLDEAALLRSIMGLMQQQTAAPNLDVLGTDLTGIDDYALMAKFDQQFGDLCETFIALKPRLAAAAQPELMVRLESHLAGAQAEIEELVPHPIFENTSTQAEPTTTEKKLKLIERLKSRAVLFGGAALCLPFLLKFGVPAILGSRQMEHFLPKANSRMEQVVSVKGLALSVKAPGQPPQSLQLAGIAPLSDHWQKEATGVISTLLESAHGQVSVSTMGSQSGKAFALVALPNGTTLQQVLLADGVAKLDNDGLRLLPADLSAKLQAAQALAKAQQKNIWSHEKEQ